MKQNHNILSQREPVVLMAVPSEELVQIKQMLVELLNASRIEHPSKLGDWIDEKEAQKLLGRKAMDLQQKIGQ